MKTNKCFSHAGRRIPRAGSSEGRKFAWAYFEFRGGQVEFLDGHLLLKFPRSKCGVYGDGAERFISAGTGTFCPVDRLKTFMTVTGSLGTNKLVFRRLQGDRMVEDLPLNYSRARDDLLTCLNPLVLDPSKYGGHSFRHGAASQAAGAGVPDRLLKRHGLWKSTGAKNIYVHESVKNSLRVSQSLNYSMVVIVLFN